MMRIGKRIRERIGWLRRRHALRIAVKEALDTLPTAVCYFHPSGTVKLCNRAMEALFRTITGRDLQSFGELQKALAHCNSASGIVRDGNVYLFPDGRAWQYSAGEVRTADGSTYTEAVFSDVTALYQKRQELQKQSVELKKMYRELQKLSENARKAAAEQEILNLKSRLHDQMNMGAAAIRQILRQHTASAENAAAVTQFRRAIQILQEESAPPEDDFAEFVRDAAVSGIQVRITGNLPASEPIMGLLLPVLREACVNAARHADATVLAVSAEQRPDAVIVRITNDGRPPAGEVVPRGGLADGMQRITEAGGRMEIRSQPAFLLTVMLPVCTEKITE